MRMLKNDKPMLLVIATDGEPSDNNKKDLIDIIRNQRFEVEREKQQIICVSFLKCSADNNETGYLDELGPMTFFCIEILTTITRSQCKTC